MRRILPVLAILGLLAGGTTLAAEAPIETKAPEPLPALTFQTMDGQEASLADFAGKVVVLNLWATWCAPCREEMPSLDRLQARFADRHLTNCGHPIPARPKSDTSAWQSRPKPGPKVAEFGQHALHFPETASKRAGTPLAYIKNRERSPTAAEVRGNTRAARNEDFNGSGSPELQPEPSGSAASESAKAITPGRPPQGGHSAFGGS